LTKLFKELVGCHAPFFSSKFCVINDSVAVVLIRYKGNKDELLQRF